jgi:hypothetical protein
VHRAGLHRCGSCRFATLWWRCSYTLHCNTHYLWLRAIIWVCGHDNACHRSLSLCVARVGCISLCIYTVTLPATVHRSASLMARLAFHAR